MQQSVFGKVPSLDGTSKGFVSTLRTVCTSSLGIFQFWTHFVSIPAHLLLNPKVDGQEEDLFLLQRQLFNRRLGCVPCLNVNDELSSRLFLHLTLYHRGRVHIKVHIKLFREFLTSTVTFRYILILRLLPCANYTFLTQYYICLLYTSRCV